MAAHRAAALALRRLASAAATASPRPALLVAPLRSQAAATTVRTLLQPAALYARRGYAARSGAGRKAPALSEDDDDDDELEAMGSGEEFDDDDEEFDDDDDMEEFDDDDEDE